MLINTLLMVTGLFIYRETLPIGRSRLTNRSVYKYILYVYLLIKYIYIKAIEIYRKTVFVLISQLTCINTYIKYVTETSHKKIVNYVKSTLDSIVGAEQFIGPKR